MKADSNRPMTAYEPFAHKPGAETVPPEAETHIPGPPGMPSDLRVPTTEPAPDELTEIGQRLASMSDALFDPNGLLHMLFAGLKERQRLDHEETMRSLTAISQTLRDVVDNQLDGLARLNKLEPQVEEHGARLKVVSLNGNGHGVGE